MQGRCHRLMNKRCGYKMLSCLFLTFTALLLLMINVGMEEPV